MTSPDQSVPAWIGESFAKTPITRLLGARPVSWDVEAARIVIAYDGKADFCNLIGTIQGGMLTAMLDNAMSFAALAHLGLAYRVPSVEFKTSFIAPARTGPLIGEGEVVRAGRSIAFLAGRLLDEAGALIATASATAIVRERNTPVG